MGFDIHRFQGVVDEELICSICQSVLEDPVQIQQCEHSYCNDCIREWLKRKRTCPQDCKEVSEKDLLPASRLLRNLLGRMIITCDFVDEGCSELVSLDALQSHVSTCVYNARRLQPCDQGCGEIIAKNEVVHHNCVKNLRQRVNVLEDQVREQKIELSEQKNKTARFWVELELLQATVKQLQVAVGDTGPVNIDRDREIIGWVDTLAEATVRDWGGIVSTPLRQTLEPYKQLLLECNCPEWLAEELVAHGHESQWPTMMRSLSVRNENRATYSRFKTRRVPDRQAVLIMQFENSHMDLQLIQSPGILVLLSHGVE